jgi:hypothetical protein
MEIHPARTRTIELDGRAVVEQGRNVDPAMRVLRVLR